MTSAQVLGVHIEVTGAQQAAAAAQQAAGGFDKFKSGMAKASKAATVGIAAIVAFGKKAADAASDVEQSFGGLESVFGDQADAVKDWANAAADAVGLARDEYATAAAKMGAQFKNMGLATKPAADATKGMIELGADLAATFGGTTQEAVDALSAALRGEADPAERYGLSLSKTAVNAELAARGQDKLQGAARRAAEAQAIMDLATKQAGGSIGQFGREADTAAGAQQRANAQWRNATADLGTALLPIMQKIGTIISAVSRWVSQNADLVQKWGVIVLGAAAAIKVLNFALNASPIARIIALVATLAAGIAVLWQKSETFRNIVTGVWNAVKTAAVTAWNVIGLIWNGIKSAAEAVWNAIGDAITAVVDVVTGAWNAAVGFFAGLWDTIKNAAATAWDWIGDKIAGVLDQVSNFGETTGQVAMWAINQLDAAQAKAAVAIDSINRSIAETISAINRAGTSAPGTGKLGGSWLTASSPGPGGASGPVFYPNATIRINVTGAGDPDATARAIERTLTDRARRTGGVVL